jgi:Tfp pilus assembly protein PilO
MTPGRLPNASPLKIYVAGAIVCAALSTGAYLMGVRPAMARHEETETRQAELKAARQRAANLAGTRNSTLAQLADTNKALQNLPLRLEPVSTVNQRLLRLTDLATKECLLTIDEMRSGAVVDGPDYQAVPILIAGSGTYPACAKFLHRLRTVFPDTAVRSFETINNSASPDAPAATFQFDLVWHAAKG